MKVNDTYVPSVGRDDAKVMLIGESPGSDEEVEGEPFVGKSGQLLTRYLSRIGINRGDVYLTNLCKYRPKQNKFENLLGTTELASGLEELDEEIFRVQPNLIVTLGNWPMYYLTGCTAARGKAGTGITSWRGSVMPGTKDHISSAEGRKVLITFHPSFIVRPTGFGQHPVFLLDLKQIKREKDEPELNYPPYLEFVDPPNLEEIAHEMSQADLLTVDIETFGDSLACVGFADSVDRGLSITFENEGGWDIARELLLSNAPKNFQYGTFDINYLKWHYGWDTNNYAFDTYIAAANLLPEFPRGLAFLNSIYTPFPYYKEDRKIHKASGELGSLWSYNIRDVIVQHWIALDMMKELEKLYGEPVDLKGMMLT